MNFEDHGTEMMSSELAPSFEPENSQGSSVDLGAKLRVRMPDDTERSINCSFVNLSSNGSLTVDSVPFVTAMAILNMRMKGQFCTFVLDAGGQTIELGQCDVYVYGESGGICSLSLDRTG